MSASVSAASDPVPRQLPSTVPSVRLRGELADPLQYYFPPVHDQGLPADLAALVQTLRTRLDETPAEDFRHALMQAMPKLRSFAAALSKDAARTDDLVQETLLKAWSNRHRFQAGSSLLAWLFTILRNLFYSEMRRRRRREVEDADGVYAGRLTALPDQEHRVTLTGLYAAIATLPQTQRAALMLVSEGCSYDEAAAILGCQIGTVKSRVSRARAQLSKFREPSLREPSGRAAMPIAYA